MASFPLPFRLAALVPRARRLGQGAPLHRALLSSNNSPGVIMDTAAKLNQGTADKIREQVHPTIKGRRRFYKVVGIRPAAVDPGAGDALAAGGVGQGSAEPAAPEDLFEVTLDGRALRSPGRRPMHLPAPLAWAVAQEWDAQAAAAAAAAEGGELLGGRAGRAGIEPSTMPLMSLCSTWLDQTNETQGAVQKNVLKYLATDTCCFYAEPVLRVLRKRQKKAFRPLHDWMEEDWGCPLATTDEVFRLAHPPATVARVRAMVHALDTAALTALQCATMESKSLVLALGVVLRRFKSVGDAEAACRLEEEFQMEQWGLVEGGHDMDRVAGKVNLSSSSAFLRLLDGPDGHAKRVERLKEALRDFKGSGSEAA